MYLQQSLDQWPGLLQGCAMYWILLISLHHQHTADGRLILHQQEKKWSEAKWACETQGMRLAVKPNDEEILSLVSSGHYWIGLAQVDHNRLYWVNGTQYIGSYILGYGRRCIMVSFYSGKIRLRSDRCLSYNMYICEDVVPPAEKYIYIGGTEIPRDNAEQLCLDRGYTGLAIVDTDERRHLFSIAMEIEYDARDVWIDLRRSGGVWTWSDGSVLTTEHWEAGYPKSYEHCAKAERDVEFLEWESENCNSERAVACFKLANHTVSPPEEGTVASGTRTTESLEELSSRDNTSTATLPTIAKSTTDSLEELSFLDNTPTATLSTTSESVRRVTPGADPSFQKVTCDLNAATPSLEFCPCLQSSAGTNFALATEVTVALLDDNLATCMRPFQGHSQLHLSINTQAAWGPTLLRIQVTGERWNCLQPTTLVYMDSVLNQSTTDPPVINKVECPSVWSNHSLDHVLVTCSYECRSAIPHKGPARFGVQMQRLSWLVHAQHMGKLCDVRAFVWL